MAEGQRYHPDDDCFNITVSRPGVGARETMLVTEVTVHGPGSDGSQDHTITKSNLGAVVGKRVSVREQINAAK